LQDAKKGSYNVRELFIDPGMHTGWSFWNRRLHPEKTGVINVSKVKGRARPDKMQYEELWEKFTALVAFYNPERCIIEDNSWWINSGKSFAAENSGALHKLTLLTGGYLRICQALGVDWELVMPQTWKGQLTPKALDTQIYMILKENYREHEREAVGIGLWKHGKL
jgi:hypothetical protein